MPKFLINSTSAQKKYRIYFTILWVALLLISLAIPLLAGSYYLRLVSLIFIYIILAIGYNISAGFSGITSFAFAAHFGVGAYVSAVAITAYNMPFFVGLTAGAIAAAIVGLLVSLPASKVKHHYLALISIGLLEMANRVFNEWTWFTGGSQGLFVPYLDYFRFQPRYPSKVLFHTTNRSNLCYSYRGTSLKVDGVEI